MERNNLRRVIVNNGYESYEGYFHGWQYKPYQNENGDAIQITCAFVEQEDGTIKVVEYTGNFHSFPIKFIS